MNALQEEGNENGKVLCRYLRRRPSSASMLLARDLALSNEFRFGNTSDNAPFVLLL